MISQDQYFSNTVTKIADIVAAEDTLDVRRFVGLLDLDRDNAKLIAYARTTYKLKQGDITKAIAARQLADRRVAEIGGNAKTAAQFVELFMSKRGITVNAAKELKTDETAPKAMVDGKVIDITAELLANDDIRNAHETFNYSVRNPSALCLQTRVLARELGYKFADNEMNDAYSNWAELQVVTRYRALVENIRHRTIENIDDMWRIFAEAFFDGDVELVIAIVQKFWHQIKRKAFDLPVCDHLMPVFEGPQHVGKSSLINYMIAPIAELSGRANFKQLTDDRIIDMWDLLVIVIDEMAGAKHSEAEAVKEIVTAPYVMRRPMTTNRFDKYVQKATLIGSYNKPLADLIRDETGNRRFAPMQFKAKPDWSALEEIDFLALIQSVDENGPDPIYRVSDKLKASQAEARYTSPVEDWFEHGNTSIFNGAAPLMMAAYSAFNEWQNEAMQPYGRMSLKKFASEVRRLSANKLIPVEVMPRSTAGFRLTYTGELPPKMRVIS